MPSSSNNLPLNVITDNRVNVNGHFLKPCLGNAIRELTLARSIELMSMPEPKLSFSKCARRLKSQDYSSDYHALESIEDYVSYVRGNMKLWTPPSVPVVKLSQAEQSSFLQLPQRLYATPSGRVVRRDAFLAGAPCTFSRAPHESNQRLIRLAVSCAVNCDISSKNVASFTSGVMAIIKAIEKLGLAFEIMSYVPWQRSWHSDASRVERTPNVSCFWLKRANDCLSKHRLNAMLVCPDAMRRLWMESCERESYDPAKVSAIGFNEMTIEQQAWFNERFDLSLPTIPEIGYNPKKLIAWCLENWKAESYGKL